MADYDVQRTPDGAGTIIKEAEMGSTDQERQREYERNWTLIRERKALEERAAELGCTPDLMQYIMLLEKKISMTSDMVDVRFEAIDREQNARDGDRSFMARLLLGAGAVGFLMLIVSVVFLVTSSGRWDV